MRIIQVNLHDCLRFHYIAEIARLYALALRQVISVSHTQIPQTEVALTRIATNSSFLNGVIIFDRLADGALRLLLLLQTDGQGQTRCVHIDIIVTFSGAVRDR